MPTLLHSYIVYPWHAHYLDDHAPDIFGTFRSHINCGAGMFPSKKGEQVDRANRLNILRW